MLDLAFDAVAIRLGFWTWVIPLDKGFFGVPAGNFYAWLFVAFSFSAFTRAVRHLHSKRNISSNWQMAVPFAAYGGLLISMTPFFALKEAFFPQAGGGLEIFWITLALFTTVVAVGLRRGRERGKMQFDWIPVIFRASFHLYFLASLFASQIFLSLPVLLAISLLMLALEIALVMLLWTESRGPKGIAKVVVNKNPL
jgi:hypothetical protein